MSEADWILEDLTNALRWAIFYAEHGHEAMHPKETYAKDGNVAISVDNARRANKSRYTPTLKGDAHDTRQSTSIACFIQR